jgi:hypothetical protein
MNRKTFLILVLVGVAVALLAVPVAALAADSNSLTSSAAQSTVPATRAEFAQLALEGLGLSPVYPPSPTFTDVSADNPYYGYVEGAAAAGLIQGLGDGAFGPDLQIAREQVATILARYLSSTELNSLGYILGTDGTHYPSLYAWYAAEGEAQLAGFSDEAAILAVHRPGVAYLAMQGIAQGSDGFFSPLSAVTQAECVALINRVSQAATSYTTEVTIPTVTSLSPSTGPSAGGTTVTISGTNFSADSSVTFGGIQATSVSVESSTLIQTVSPAGTPGATVQVAVTDSAGTSPDTSTSEFSYANDVGPTITSISPNLGQYGNTVTIYGTNFDEGSLGVYFGNVMASGVTYVSPNQLQVIVPAGADGSTVRVMVVTTYGASPDTTADYFTYSLGTEPTVSSISPNVGWEGDAVTIFGSGFDADNLMVYFGGQPAEAVTYLDSNQIQAIVPAGANGTMVPVTVYTNYGSSADTSADYFTYYYYPANLPVISTISPSYGPSTGGTTVYIQGSGFTGDSVVYFGSYEAAGVFVNSSSLITAVSPAGVDGTTVPVSVTTYAGTSVETPADDFAYVNFSAGPTITSISPNVGWQGDTVTIQGTNFDGADLAVYFGGVGALSVTYLSPTEIAAVVPPGTSNTIVRVTVVTDEGTSPSTQADRFFYQESDGHSFHTPNYPHL